MADTARSGWAEIDGARLYYELAGAGHPLVLMHAGIADSRMWDDQWDTFAQRYTVLRYDLRGMGRSPMPAGPFAHHEDLRGLLSYLGLGSAYLVGASMGGMTAIDFTLTYPHMVDALVAVDARISGNAPPESLIQAWEEVDQVVERGDVAGAVELELRMWVDGPRRQPAQIDPTVRERVREMNANNFAVYSEAGIQQPLEPPALGRLGEIGVPTLVIAGAEDQPHVLASADLLEAGIPGARKVVLPDTAHVPSMERPEEFNCLLLDFLESLQPTGQ